MFNLEKMKSDGGTSSGSTVPSATSVSASAVAASSTVEKCTSVDKGPSLRKRGRRGTSEQLAAASGSTTRVPAKKGKEPVEIEEASEQGYTLCELCKVEDRAGAEKYSPPSALIEQVHDAGRLVQSQHERILALRAVNKELKHGVSQNLIAAAEFRVKELEDANKLRVELESLKSQQRDMEQEVGVLRSSLDGARNDWACLVGDVLSLTEAATLLDAELKAEGSRAVATYKASQEFESGLEKMVTFSYEFGYRVALEQL
ncbi:hypothetical protein BHE74_00013362 [Ensete ventricosum]|nr:hypothetical protein GW17_00039115 [Ensete ventricosum]RWW78415.1 hypothetical protein BHE74_00013362 [Ensete ventricosum]RZR91829.1 hypothetical protein BHM03_00020013 [Ensete ventricosum]